MSSSAKIVLAFGILVNPADIEDWENFRDNEAPYWDLPMRVLEVGYDTDQYFWAVKASITTVYERLGKQTPFINLSPIMPGLNNINPHSKELERSATAEGIKISGDPHWAIITEIY